MVLLFKFFGIGFFGNHSGDNPGLTLSFPGCQFDVGFSSGWAFEGYVD